MECKDVVAKYAEYEQDLLDENEGNDIGEHLEGCPECQQYAEGLDRLTQVLDDLAPAEPPKGMWDHISERIEPTAGRRAYVHKTKNPAGRTMRRALVRPVFSISMALAVLAFSLWLGFLNLTAIPAPMMVEMDGDTGGFATLHAGMSAQQPLAHKGAWAVAALAAKGMRAESSPPSSSGSGTQ